MRFLFWLVALPLGAVVVAFAVVNRSPVVLSFEPLPFVVELPVFLVVLGAFVVGVGAGGAAAWLGGRRMRRLARGQRRRIAALERELDVFREGGQAAATDEGEAADRPPVAKGEG